MQTQAEWAPHIVLLALDLPDMAAGTLVARLAEQSGGGILVLSGHDREFYKQALLARGAYDVMSKPMRASSIVAHIRAMQRRLGQAAPVPEMLQ